MALVVKMGNIKSLGPSVKVTQQGGSLKPVADAITLQKSTIPKVNSILDVNEVNMANGATIVYNRGTGQYEVRPLEESELAGDASFDGGTF